MNDKTKNTQCQTSRTIASYTKIFSSFTRCQKAAFVSFMEGNDRFPNYHYESQQTMADRADISLRTMSSAIACFMDFGLIHKVNRGENETCIYTLHSDLKKTFVRASLGLMFTALAVLFSQNCTRVDNLLSTVDKYLYLVSKVNSRNMEGRILPSKKESSLVNEKTNFLSSKVNQKIGSRHSQKWSTNVISITALAMKDIKMVDIMQYPVYWCLKDIGWLKPHQKAIISCFPESIVEYVLGLIERKGEIAATYPYLIRVCYDHCTKRSIAPNLDSVVDLINCPDSDIPAIQINLSPRKNKGSVYTQKNDEFSTVASTNSHVNKLYPDYKGSTPCVETDKEKMLNYIEKGRYINWTDTERKFYNIVCAAFKKRLAEMGEDVDEGMPTPMDIFGGML